MGCRLVATAALAIGRAQNSTSSFITSTLPLPGKHTRFQPGLKPGWAHQLHANNKHPLIRLLHGSAGALSRAKTPAVGNDDQVATMTPTIYALSSGGCPAGIAVIRVSGPQAEDAVNALAVPSKKGRPHGSGNLADVTPSGLVRALATKAKGRPELFAAVELEVVRRGLAQFTPQHVTNLVWAFATAGVDAPGLFAAVEKKLVKRRLANSSVKDLSGLVWAFAKAGVAAPGLSVAVEQELLRRGLRNLSPAELDNLLWAFATAGNGRPELFAAVELEVVRRGLAQFTPQHLTNLVWAFATAGVRAQRLFAAVEKEVTGRELATFDPQQLSRLLWSYAAAGVEAPKLFGALEIEVLGRKLAAFNSQALSNLLWSYAAAGVKAPGLFAAVGQMLAEYELEQFTPEELVRLVWAYAKAGAPTLPPRTATLAGIRDPATGEMVDQGMALWFPGPNSFTGEDVAELHVHGGPAVVRSVLRALGSLPFMRMAEAGEFTMRAFHNNKLDITQVEGLADLLAAETHSQLKLALSHQQGVAGRVYEGWRRCLLRCMAQTEAVIDFGEEEGIADEVATRVMPLVRALSEELSAHLKEGGRAAEIITQGLRVCVLGRPNAGKSSLVNSIVGHESSIVSPLPGTTRDTKDVSVDVGGYKVVLTDCAGLHDTDDSIEAEGIRRALAAARSSHVCLWMVDAEDILARLPTNAAAATGSTDWTAASSSSDNSSDISRSSTSGSGTSGSGTSGSGTNGRGTSGSGGSILTSTSANAINEQHQIRKGSGMEDGDRSGKPSDEKESSCSAAERVVRRDSNADAGDSWRAYLEEGLWLAAHLRRREEGGDDRTSRPGNAGSEQVAGAAGQYCSPQNGHRNDCSQPHHTSVGSPPRTSSGAVSRHAVTGAQPRHAANTAPPRQLIMVVSKSDLLSAGQHAWMREAVGGWLAHFCETIPWVELVGLQGLQGGEDPSVGQGGAGKSQGGGDSFQEGFFEQSAAERVRPNSVAPARIMSPSDHAIDGMLSPTIGSTPPASTDPARNSVTMETGPNEAYTTAYGVDGGEEIVPSKASAHNEDSVGRFSHVTPVRDEFIASHQAGRHGKEKETAPQLGKDSLSVQATVVWPPFFVSGTTGQGLADLCHRLRQMAVSSTSGVAQGGHSGAVTVGSGGMGTAGSSHVLLVTRERHRQHIGECLEALQRYLELSARGEGVELQAEELRAAATSLGRITGKVDIEAVLGEIFSHFCVGK